MRARQRFSAKGVRHRRSFFIAATTLWAAYSLYSVGASKVNATEWDQRVRADKVHYPRPFPTVDGPLAHWNVKEERLGCVCRAVTPEGFTGVFPDCRGFPKPLDAHMENDNTECRKILLPRPFECMYGSPSKRELPAEEDVMAAKAADFNCSDWEIVRRMAQLRDSDGGIQAQGVS